MGSAKNGDVVKVHYTGTLGDGTQFDSSANREPLEFTLGEGQIIPGFEEAVVGMSPGEAVTTTIPADQAYGPHDQNLIFLVNQEQIPDDLELRVGQELELRQPDGQAIGARVAAISDEDVTLDANHPLAGQALTFDIQLMEIV